MISPIGMIMFNQEETHPLAPVVNGYTLLDTLVEVAGCNSATSFTFTLSIIMVFQELLSSHPC